MSASLPGLSARAEGSFKELAAPATPDYPLDNTGLREWNAGGAAGYTGPAGDYRLTYLHYQARLGVCSCLRIESSDDFYAQFKRRRPIGAELYDSEFRIERPFQAVAHDLTLGRAGWRLDGLGQISATYSFQHDHRREYDIVREATTGPQFNFRLYRPHSRCWGWASRISGRRRPTRPRLRRRIRAPPSRPRPPSSPTSSTTTSTSPPPSMTTASRSSTSSSAAAFRASSRARSTPPSTAPTAASRSRRCRPSSSARRCRRCARNVTGDSYLVFVPPDRLRGSVTYPRDSLGSLGKSFAAVSGTYVARQTRFDRAADFARPPAAYFLFGAEIGSELGMGDQIVKFALQGSNLLDARCRDYTSLLRYFADQPGWQLLARLTVEFAVTDSD
jgi:hypothetical protein